MRGLPDARLADFGNGKPWFRSGAALPGRARHVPAMIQRLGSFLLFVLGTSTGSNGTVVDAASGQPVAGARVRVEAIEVVTDAAGRFRIDPLPGQAPLEVSAPGYLPERVAPEDLARGGSLEIALVPERSWREDVSVTAPAVAAEAPSTEAVGPDRVLDAAGAADNVFRVLRSLPGVTATQDVGSRLSVRGGGPDQNLTVVDGVELHNPYRLFGLTSAFNPETVERFTLTAGGFGVKHGDRLSSLLVVENRAGRRDRALAGSATVSLTDANVLSEGRLPGVSEASWLATVRRTYFDLVAERFFVDDDLPGFLDGQFIMDMDMGRAHRVRIQGLRSREDADASVEGYYQGEGTDFKSASWNDLVSLRVLSTLGSRAHLATTAAWSRGREAVALSGGIHTGMRRSNAPDDAGIGLERPDFDRTFGVRDLSLRQDLAFQPGAGRHTLEVGYELHALRADVAFEIRGDRNPLAANGTSVLGGAGLPDAFDSRSSSSRNGVWLQDTVRPLRHLALEAGLRFDHSRLTGTGSWQPRVGATCEIGANTRLRAAAGAYSQSPGYEKLYQGDYFLDLGSARALGLRHERAGHVLLGLERRFRGGLVARIEAFYRRFDGLVLGRLESDAERLRRLARYDFPPELRDSLPAEPTITTTPDELGRGRSYGWDVYLARDAAPDARVTGWIAYTYGVASRTAYGRTAPFEYDRRHAASLVARGRMGAKLDLALTARLATGFPRTPPVGLRVAAVPDALDQDGDGDRAELVPERDGGAGLLVYQPDYGGVSNLGTDRLPLFARVDLRASFWPRGRRGRWEVFVDVMNVLARRNPEFFRPELVHDPAGDRPRLAEHPSGSVPFLPSLGVRFRF